MGGEGRVRLELGEEAVLEDDATDGDAELYATCQFEGGGGRRGKKTERK